MNVLLEAKQINVQIGDKRICEQFSLRVNAGDRIGILGQNGSGKTTLLRALAGLQPISAGSISMNERHLGEYTTRELATRRSVLPQEEHILFPGTVLESVLAGRHPYLHQWQNETEHDRRIANDTLRLLELHELRQRQLTTLSGGERRRVAIARMLTQQTPLMFLDEPLNHLDLRHQAGLMAHLATLCQQQHAVLFSAHDPNVVAQHASQVLLLFGNGTTRVIKDIVELDADSLSELYQLKIQCVNLAGRPHFMNL